jgi:hypothetical protein
VDPDRLALLALGERVDTEGDELTDHLASCQICQRDLQTLRSTVELAQETIGYRGEPLQAPAHLWDGIASELGLDGSAPGHGRSGTDARGASLPPVEDPSAPGGDASGDRRSGGIPFRGAPAGGAAEGTGGGLPGAAAAGGSTGSGADDASGGDGLPGGTGRGGVARGGAGGDVGGGSEGDDAGAGSGVLGEGAFADSVRSGRHRRGIGRTGRDETQPGTERRWARTAVALSAAAAVGVLGTLAATRPWADDVPTVRASSTADLGAVNGGPSGVQGRATVVEGDDGPELQVTTSGLPLQSGFYQVWVFDGRTRMQAVGVLGKDSTATLPLPDTLDLRTFNVVDISLEPYDGDQTHSKDSVLRGTLTN